MFGLILAKKAKNKTKLKQKSLEKLKKVYFISNRSINTVDQTLFSNQINPSRIIFYFFIKFLQNFRLKQ